MKPIIIQPAEGTVRIEIVDYSAIVGNALGMLCVLAFVLAFVWFVKSNRRRNGK